MRLEWIRDLLAVMEGGSLARAAERRFVTQSAFTRRIRLIEDSLGAELFDRSRKPLEMLASVRALEPEMRASVARLEALQTALSQAGSASGQGITFACQHAIAATVSPRVVAELIVRHNLSVKEREGNRDECLFMLLSGEVDFVLSYSRAEDRHLPGGQAFDSAVLDTEILVPVCAPSLRPEVDSAVLPVVSYPPEVFFGRVFTSAVAPTLPPTPVLHRRAETALSLAAFQHALSGIGAAWLPLSLVCEAVEDGRLIRLDDRLPAAELDLMVIWLASSARPDLRDVIAGLVAHFASGA